MKRTIHLSTIALLFFSLQAQAQILRGTVRHADNGEAVMGATVALRFSRGDAASVSLATNPSGLFFFEKLRPGYYLLSVSAQGFETQTIAEVNVSAGKEQVLDIALRPSARQLGEVTVLATRPGLRAPLPLGEIPLTRDQTLRFPAMFFDPARLATAYPGVAQIDDGTNVISIRGNSPASVRWRLEGVDIVNPNHLPNAGTFSDRPAAASGGILMFSAQLLDNSSLLTGPMPAGYGDALGGVMDMNLRRGNNRQHEFTVQAGLVGFDLAAEGPIGQQKTTSEGGSNGASYLVNYRYSTVGLLGQLGVSFGDEQINFQDLSFHLGLDGKKGGRWSLFGLGGLSENIFRHKTDPAEIKAYKDFFDIDFESKTGVMGVSNWSPLGRNAWLKTSVAISQQTNERASNSAVYTEWASKDHIEESKTSASLTFSQRLSPQAGLMAGTMLTRQFFEASALSESTNLVAVEHHYTLIQPWIEANWKSRDDKNRLRVGLHFLYFATPTLKDSTSDFSVEPRFLYSRVLRKGHQLHLAAGWYSQIPPLWLLSGASSLKASKISIAYAWQPNTPWAFRAELYWQWNTRTYYTRSKEFSIPNVSEFMLRKSYNFGLLANGNNQGIEISAERRLIHGWFLLANASLFNAQYAFSNDEKLSTRWDLGRLANLTFGKEWQREKRPGKERTIGLNARVVWSGGVREPDFNFVRSKEMHTTVIDESRGYARQYPDYFRIDLRVYWRKNLGNRRNSTFALDLQNLTGQQNLAYHYYDAFTDKIETKYQLGTIPNFSWRLEF